MSRKINVAVNAVAIIEVPIKLDMLIRADEGANLDKMVRGYIRNGTENFAKGDIENVAIEEIGGTIHGLADQVDDKEYDTLQDLLEKKSLKIKFVDAEVTDSR